MSWTDFMMCVGIAYTVYYASIILMDILKSQKKFASADQGAETLHFSELEETKVVESFPNNHSSIKTENTSGKSEAITGKKRESFEFTQYYQAKVEGGAQNLNDLLQLAQANSIEMKRKLIM